MEKLETRGIITHFCSVEDIRFQIEHLPKQKRYYISLEYVCEDDLHEILLLGQLLQKIGAGANILINAYTHPLAIDFLTTELRETEHNIYISNRF